MSRPESAAAGAASAVAALWERSREAIVARVDAMEEVVTALAENRLDEEVLQEGRCEAHKLAGAAGTFGFPRASQLARTFELALAAGTGLHVDRVPELAALVAALRRELAGAPAVGGRSASAHRRPAPDTRPDTNSDPRRAGGTVAG